MPDKLYLFAGIYLCAVNLCAAGLTIYDKCAAKRGLRRIRERTLLLISLLGGSPLMLLTMHLIHHKTKHKKFMVGIPLIIALQIAAIWLWSGTEWFPLHKGGKEPVAYKRISTEQALDIINNDTACILLDVRTDWEYRDKRIEGAVLIPDTLIHERALTELPDKDAVILVYCRSGRRSELAAREMIALGYTQVYDFGGIIDWPYATVSG